MLFNSLSFLLVFLPACLVLYFVLGAVAPRGAQALLCAASLVFYSWLGLRFLPLLVFSILGNYVLGRLIIRQTEDSAGAKFLLVVGVTGNLLVLVYYKYLFDLTGWLGAQDGQFALHWGSVVLPLGISFFTFTQIGFLVDTAAGLTRSQNFLEYVLFVTFFPHVIAGPILHHREMMPQFRAPATYRFNAQNFALGLSIFVIGLAKKTLLADDLFRPYADAAFAPGQHLATAAAWTGALSYFLQLYFDFSGYSEMAMGLARLFNVKFPANFDAPYRATNIIDFWQRWHASLTRFLTLYVYSPVSLALNRRLAARHGRLTAALHRRPGVFAALVAFPTMLTMTLAGVWHGSGLTFLVFGALHGVFLTIAHGWRLWGGRVFGSLPPAWHRVGTAGKILLTCLAVLVAEIFFRAGTVADAARMLAGMAGQSGPNMALSAEPGAVETLLQGTLLRHQGVALLTGAGLGNGLTILLGLAIVWLLPDVLQIFAAFEPSLTKTRAARPLLAFAWKPNAAWGAVLGLLAVAALLNLGGASAFLYFRF